MKRRDVLKSTHQTQESLLSDQTIYSSIRIFNMRSFLVLIAILLASAITYGQQSNKELVSKCGSEIVWKNDLSSAYSEASELKKLVLCYIQTTGSHMYNGGPLNYYMYTGPFTTLELVTLINRKFVPVKLASGAGLPEKLPKFCDPALVFVTPDKKTVHKIGFIRTINDDFFYNQMLLVLQQNAELNGPSKQLGDALKAAEGDKSVKSRLNLAREYLNDGELTKAKELLETLAKEAVQDESALVHYELAKTFRLMRDSKHALEQVKLGREKTKDEKISGDLTAEEGLVYLKTGELDKSKQPFEKVLKDHAGCSRFVEAKYYLGVIAISSQDEKSAKEIWSSIVKDHSDTRWASKSAAHLVRTQEVYKASRGTDGAIGLSALSHCFEEVSWLNEVHYKTLKDGTTWKREEKELDDMVSLAIKFLLKSQRSDGSWNDCRYAWEGPTALPNCWMAATAVAATGLLEHRDKNPEAIDKAVKKATEYMISEKNLTHKGKESCYSHGYKVLFFGKLLPTLSKKEDQDKIKEAAEKVINALEKQQGSGYWSHEYDNPFTTGCIIICLQIAKEAGIEVPDRIFEKSAKKLMAARDSKGTFPYSTGKGGSWVTGRDPMCEMALFFAGQSSLENIEKAMESTLKNIEPLLQVRRTDYHAGPAATAGFFFFHNFHHLTEATTRLKEGKKEEFIKKLREILLNIQEIDGAFVDSHELGRTYGTGLALLALKNVK